MRGRVRVTEHDYPHAAPQIRQPEPAAIRLTHMGTLPQLIEEDISQLDAVLLELLRQSEASTALIADKGGFLITKYGNDRDFDLTSIAALASGAFMASQSIASIAGDTGFNSTYQQGETYSIFIQSVDENCLLLVL